MKAGNVIEVNNATKMFRVFFDKGTSLKEKLLFKKRNRYEERVVLNKVSFEVKKGEAIGLIGKNGCGKSTTLKLLSRIIYPNSGSIEIAGRVSSLLELGAGFHPDLSGRENIYTNASIFGLSRKEIDSRLQDIIAFSELEGYLDNPVRTYSSGMYMRLAFSVAISVDADVLLIDEILAVGDISFQAKCFERLKEIKRNGTTIVIVSHAMGQIEQICDRAIWLDKGKIKEEGITKFVADHYLGEMEEQRLKKIEVEYQANLKSGNNEDEAERNQKIDNVQKQKDNMNSNEKTTLPDFCSPRTIRSGNRNVEITNVCMLNHTGEQSVVFKTGELITVKMRYRSNISDLKANFTIGITRDDGTYCYGSSVLLDSNEVFEVKEEGEATFIIEENILLSGKYLLDVGVQAEDYLPYDTLCSVVEFRILTPVINEFGIFSINHQWEVDGKKIERKNI